MASLSPSVPLSSPPAAGADAVRAGPARIDASAGAPVLFFLVFGALWLLGASALALISAFQLHVPSAFGDAAWLTYGRSRPAFANAFLYGWGFNAAFALALWLMARLSQAPVRAASLAVVGGLFWNAGVAIGVIGILRGDTTGVQGLELPRYVAPVLFLSYALIGAAAVATFRFRRSGPIYASQWYLLAALFWFPWVYSIAQVTLGLGAARGTVQSVLSAWYAYNVYGLWLAPGGLAAIYYFLPKLLGRTIYDYRLARMGFWSYGLFASWAGARLLIGGPVPAWVQTVGTAACLMLLIPVVVIAINHLGSLPGRLRRVKESPSLAFIVFAAIAFTVVGLGTAAMSLRTVAEVTQFTFVEMALEQAGSYAFFTMAAFGGIYFLVPRLVLRPWPSRALITAHFWFTAAGIVLAVTCLAAGGLLQGLAVNDVERYPEFTDAVARAVPFLAGHSVAWVLLAAGHVIFAAHLVLMLIKPRAVTAASALFGPPPALEVVQ